MKICIVFGSEYYINESIYNTIHKFPDILAIYYIDNIPMSKEFANNLADKNNICFFGSLNKLFKKDVNLSLGYYTLHVTISGKKCICNIAPFNSDATYNAIHYINLFHSNIKTEIHRKVILYYISKPSFVMGISASICVFYFGNILFGHVDMNKKYTLLRSI